MLMSIPSYVILWSIIFTGLGAVWYIIDRTHGVKWYRWYYNLTHKTPLPEDKEIGFIYNRSTKRKYAIATIVSTIQSLLAIYKMQVNPLVELIMWIVEVQITMIGFHIGPMVYGWWKERDKAFQVVDDIESGKIDFASEAGKKIGILKRFFSKNIIKPIKGSMNSHYDEVKNADLEREKLIAQQAVKEDVEKEKESKLDSELDPRKAIDAFVKRRR